MRRAVILLCLAAGCLGYTAGCRHPTGYTGVYARITPDEGETRVERLPIEDPLRLLKAVTPDSSVIELRLEELEVTSGPATRETWGRATWAPYRWFDVLAKPIVAITIVSPFILSIYSPHEHHLGNWRASDYWRDVAAWWNPLSGMPTAPRDMEVEPRLLSIEELFVPVAQRRVPVPGRKITLFLDERRVSETVSDAEGLVRFDLAPQLTASLGTADHILRFSLAQGDGETVDFTMELKGTIVQRYIEKHPDGEKTRP